MQRRRRRPTASAQRVYDAMQLVRAIRDVFQSVGNRKGAEDAERILGLLRATSARLRTRWEVSAIQEPVDVVERDAVGDQYTFPGWTDGDYGWHR